MLLALMTNQVGRFEPLQLFMSLLQPSKAFELTDILNEYYLKSINKTTLLLTYIHIIFKQIQNKDLHWLMVWTLRGCHLNEVDP